MRRVPTEGFPYREFYYPLNAFMHILTHEEGGVRHLHYGLFDRPDESIGAAQEHSNELLLASILPPPCGLLEVGIGLGTTLRQLASMGYDAEGITPDAQQIAFAKARYGNAIRVHHAAFEAFEPERVYDVVVFQESSQYIPADTLFALAALLAPRVVVLDEFALRPLDPPGLHSLDAFLAAAERQGFEVVEHTDLSRRAAPTIPYFMDRLPRYRDRLVADLGLTNTQVDELIASGKTYVARYESGDYGYRLLRFERRG